jgi:hypothetical protein
MSHVIDHSQGKVRPPNQPRPTVVRVKRLAALPVRSWVHWRRARRISRAARPNVDSPKKWHRRLRVRILEVLAIVLAFVLLARLGWATYVVVRGKNTSFERYCDNAGTCDVLYGFFTPFLSIAAATALFLIWRLQRVTKPMVSKAKNKPRELVPTAGTIIDRIVGRRELCLVIMEVLHDRESRCPYLLVGGVGTGKTAVLVQLTEMLANKNAVPVPIRLRDARDQLNFAELAQRKFEQEVGAGVLPQAFAERVWRQLRTDDRIVVLADGLEEAFAGSKNEKDRDNLIRQAIQQAREEKLPLVIASRQHQALEATQTALIELEPLSEEAALDYIEGTGQEHYEPGLVAIVEIADITDAPLYLQITRQLYERHLLGDVTGSTGTGQPGTYGADRSALRWRLLEKWRKALIDGHLHPEFAIDSQDRKKAIECLSALACIGLQKDELEVSFQELTGTEGQVNTSRLLPQGASVATVDSNGPDYPAIWDALKKRIPGIQPDASTHHYISMLSVAATQGEQLGLVEMRGTKVRFPHSILQAYLGSTFLGSLSEADLQKALKDPSRELLIAMVLDSRRGPANAGKSGQAERSTRATRVQLLREAAQNRYDAKALDIYSAALEIDSVQTVPQHHDVAESLVNQWSHIRVGDRRTIEEAKLGLVHRFGEALREIARRHLSDITPAYQEFFKIACQEESYPVRLAIAEEIGLGGNEAFRALCHGRPDPWSVFPDHETALLAAEKLRQEKAKADYGNLLNPQHPETATERAERIEQEHEIYELASRENRKDRTEYWHELVMRAWLAPMLLVSIGDEYRDEAFHHLDDWLNHKLRSVTGDDKSLPISLEVALAQGFKNAANRRAQDADDFSGARRELAKRAKQMLERTRFWYCQLTLIHALCLWALSSQSDEPPPGGSDQGQDRQKANARDAGPVETVAEWLSKAGSPGDPAAQQQSRRAKGGEREHPFVAEAGDLAALALESGHPERFIWIDESGVMNQVGSRPERQADIHRQSQWIPPSAGWSALDRRAQQLLADVLLMLNLAEGGDLPPIERERRLDRANSGDLPRCLTEDRAILEPGRTIGMPGQAQPEYTCGRHGCSFDLCPYPPSGALPRAELSEAFCRRQQALLGHRWRRFFTLQRKTAPWQGTTVKELKDFWAEMAGRTRPHEPSV